MKLNDLIIALNYFAPFESQEKWDNSGLLVGDKNREISDVYLSLDVSYELVKSIPENSVLITHHPLIFTPLKTIDFNSYQGRIIKELIKKNIDYISMHTNYDIHQLNRYFINKILKINDFFSTENIFLSTYEIEKININDFVKEIAEKMGIDELQFVNANKEITKVGVCTGSGGSLLQYAIDSDVDVLLTGDVTHHVAMEAIDMGINIIDITHYHSEKIFCDSMYELFEHYNNFSDVMDLPLLKDLKFTKVDSKNPFSKLKF